MPTNNPVSFRLPIHLPPDVHPSVSEALRVHDDAINDLQQAIPYLKSSINTNTSSIASMSATSTASETVVAGASSNVIGEVNNQSGNTFYATQPSDYGAFILFNDTSSVAVTLSTGVTFTIPWYANFSNFGTGTVTLTPQSGTINGSGSLSLSTGQWAFIWYDNTNFGAIVYAPPSAIVTQIIAGSNITISPSGGTGAVTINATGGAGTGTQYGNTGNFATGSYTASLSVTFATPYLSSTSYSLAFAAIGLPETSTNTVTLIVTAKSSTGFTVQANTCFTDQPITNASFSADWIATGILNT